VLNLSSARRFKGLESERLVLDEEGEEKGVDWLMVGEEDEDEGMKAEIKDLFLLIPLFRDTVASSIGGGSRKRDPSD
jgi:hypothetical protein